MSKFSQTGLSNFSTKTSEKLPPCLSDVLMSDPTQPTQSTGEARHFHFCDLKLCLLSVKQTSPLPTLFSTLLFSPILFLSHIAAVTFLHLFQFACTGAFISFPQSLCTGLLTLLNFDAYRTQQKFERRSIPVHSIYKIRHEKIKHCVPGVIKLKRDGTGNLNGGLCKFCFLFPMNSLNTGQSRICYCR